MILRCNLLDDASVLAAHHHHVVVTPPTTKHHDENGVGRSSSAWAWRGCGSRRRPACRLLSCCPWMQSASSLRTLGHRALRDTSGPHPGTMVGNLEHHGVLLDGKSQQRETIKTSARKPAGSHKITAQE